MKQTGIQIEKEHSGTYNYLRNYCSQHHKLPSAQKFFGRIASEHNKEFRGYYPALKKMEAGLQRRK